MKKMRFFAAVVILMLLVPLSCGYIDRPSDDGTPEPAPHDGVFTSQYGTMTFNGDGESITFDFTPEFAEAAGLPAGECTGTYVFLFHHGEWRYDKAECFRITAADASCDFNNDFTLTDENTISIQSPLDGTESIKFVKRGK